MTTLKLSPNALGSGQFTIAAPNSNSTRTMTLSDSDGTIYIAPGDGIQALAGGIPAARTITAGTGISVSNGDGVGGNPTITNSGVTSIVAGTNITISGGTGAVTINAAGGGFPSGTAMLFVQTSAPTGWTKSTTHNDKALRVVSGSASSGGSSAFSTVFTNQTPTITTSGLSAAATTLSTSQMPAHNHGLYAYDPCGGTGVGVEYIRGGGFPTPNTTAITNTGGGGSHTHSLTGSATSSAITLAVQYVDVIIATKD